MTTDEYMASWLSRVDGWLREQSDARLERDLSTAMAAVRGATKALGAPLPVGAICDQMEASLKQALRDHYLQRAAEAFFERFVQRGMEAEGPDLPSG